MRGARTTTSCRAFALATLLIACVPAFAAPAEEVVPPKLPVALAWPSVDIGDGLNVSPVTDGERVYLAFRSALVTARELHEGAKELWRINRAVLSPMIAANGMVFLSAGGAIEALRGTDGKTVWTAPQIATTAPLAMAHDTIVAVTETEAIAIKPADGTILWRHPAGGVKLAPAIDGDRVYLGANDGLVLALKLDSGDEDWKEFIEGGVTAIAAYRGLVYVGGGDKQFYCLKNGKTDWPARIGASVIGRIEVDDERVYFGAKDNLVRAFDRKNGVQRWQEPMRNRPYSGVIARGHVVFVPVGAAELPMLFDQNGRPSGTLPLPGQLPQDLSPDVVDTPDGLRIVVVTGGLSNVWQLTLFQSAGELPLVPLADLVPQLGAPLLTDPILEPLMKVLGSLVFGDPPLVPLADVEWPVRMLDPPLVPLTTIPGLQLRPLSPQLPPRRGGSGPGG